MTTATNNKEQLIQLASELGDIMKSNKWVSRYDVEADALSITVDRLSDDARIRYVDNEIAVYISRNGIEGIFIEYFKSNFVKHIRKTVAVFGDKKKKISQDGDSDLIVNISAKRMKEITPNLEKAIRVSVADKLNWDPQV